ncbi:MAG: hypothetical protein ACYSTL_07315, partial [Planctomycetota bacterium]
QLNRKRRTAKKLDFRIIQQQVLVVLAPITRSLRGYLVKEATSQIGCGIGSAAKNCITGIGLNICTGAPPGNCVPEKDRNKYIWWYLKKQKTWRGPDGWGLIERG